jgi:tetratricopeptide (TPR) repeat protein
MTIRLPLSIALTFALTGTLSWAHAPSYAQTTTTIQPNSPICQGLSEYEATGKIDRVIAALDKAIAADNKFIDAYLYRGALIGLVKEDFKAAIADFDRILAIDPNHVRALAYRGVARAKAQDTGAMADLDRAIALAPNSSVPYLIKYLITVGQISPAESTALAQNFLREGNRFMYFYTLTNIAGSSSASTAKSAPRLTTAKAYFDRGVTKFEALDMDGATADFDRAIELDPKYPNAHLYRGAAGLKLRRETSVKDLDRAVALNPQDALPYIMRTNIHGGLELGTNGRVKMHGDLANIIKLDPNSFFAYITKSNALKYYFDDPKGAIDDTMRASTILNSPCNNATAKSTLERDKLANLETYLVVNLFLSTGIRRPMTGIDYHLAGITKLKLGDYRSALADFDRSIAMPNPYTDNYTQRAQIKADKLGDYRGALADFSRAIELEVVGFKPYLLRAKLKAEKLKDIKGGQQDFDLLITDAPNGKNYSERAEFKQKYLKNKAGAIADYRQALKVYRELKDNEGIELTLTKLKSLGVKG